MGLYVNGTYSKPCILLCLKSIREACDEYETGIDCGIQTTIVHELGHAIQQARDEEFDEDEAEEFAYQYEYGLFPLTLLEKEKVHGKEKIT